MEYTSFTQLSPVKSPILIGSVDDQDPGLGPIPGLTFYPGPSKFDKNGI